MNPSAPGRGPRSFGRWYAVHLRDGRVLRARYEEVDFTARDKAEHVLTFSLEDGSEVVVAYRDIVSTEPLNPRIRRREGLPT